MFLGWVVVCMAGECVALSLAELASRYPTSAGPYYWAYQLAPPKTRTVFSFVNGWVWLIGNWTITLSVNFGMASLIAATVALFHPDYVMDPWQLLLIFYAVCLSTFLVAAFCNDFLPTIDTLCAVFTLVSIVVTLICLSVKADVGRHSVADTLVCALPIRDFRLLTNLYRVISIPPCLVGETFLFLSAYCREHIRKNLDHLRSNCAMN